jgi:uncharacterized membrane protein
VISHSIEIARPPAEVFAYIDQLDRHGEWQETIAAVRVLTEGPTRVGTRVVETRKVPGGDRDVTYEITEQDPPRRQSWQGIDGPVRSRGTVIVEPLDGGTRSRLTIELDLVGHGAGRLVAPLARHEAGRHLPEDVQRLKELLEAGG